MNDKQLSDMRWSLDNGFDLTSDACLRLLDEIDRLKRKGHVYSPPPRMKPQDQHRYNAAGRRVA